jgi:uncharacterized protein
MKKLFVIATLTALDLQNRPSRSILLCVSLLVSVFTSAGAQTNRVVLNVKPTDVIPTGNEWIALPTIRASDGALESFNVLSMRDRGLLEVSGDRDTPAIGPYFIVGGKPVAFENPSWQLIESWIPTATLNQNGLEFTLTYCAPYGARAALIKLTVANRSSRAVSVVMGLHASWGRLSRVTYTPVELRGQRTMIPVPWGDAENPGQAFAFVDSDTRFAWSVVYPESSGKVTGSPVSGVPALDASHPAILQRGEVAEAHFIIGVGVEEYSASQSAQALAETIDREGVETVIHDAAAWCHAHSRTTGRPDLDLLMNRNLLFTALYAWGRTLDTEQLVGVTSRSPRYYVSAAYWDRDAMLWSFPGLLDIDTGLAREALEYSLTVQLRNTGTHSRFIDGIVLEDGFELDEAAAPLLALSQSIERTGDITFLTAHREALLVLRDRISSRYDSASGLYSTLQDAQDQYRKQAFSTYDNVVVWRVMKELSFLYLKLGDAADATKAEQQASKLHSAIMNECLAYAPGSGGKIFVSATDGKQPMIDPILADVPPGSLLKLPALGFVSEDDPVFGRTYDWLHSNHYAYSYSDKSLGLPGSYRLPFTTSWSVADHLFLKRGRDRALKVIHGTTWDGGIISEGVDSASGIVDQDGRAFATAAGYVGHTICAVYCVDERTDKAVQ